MYEDGEEKLSRTTAPESPTSSWNEMNGGEGLWVSIVDLPPFLAWGSPWDYTLSFASRRIEKGRGSFIVLDLFEIHFVIKVAVDWIGIRSDSLVLLLISLIDFFAQEMTVSFNTTVIQLLTLLGNMSEH